MTRVRTIDEAIAELKAQDGKTALTRHALRQLIIKGDMPSVKVGRKYLINFAVLEDYLKGSSTTQPPQVTGGIRPLVERA